MNENIYSKEQNAIFYVYLEKVYYVDSKFPLIGKL